MQHCRPDIAYCSHLSPYGAKLNIIGTRNDERMVVLRPVISLPMYLCIYKFICLFTYLPFYLFRLGLLEVNASATCFTCLLIYLLCMFVYAFLYFFTFFCRLFAYKFMNLYINLSSFIYYAECTEVYIYVACMLS